MILEAFAKYLQNANPDMPAEQILARWLWERLSIPPETPTDQVLHLEIGMTLPKSSRSRMQANGMVGPIFAFKGLSTSGAKLLLSLREYALSYEQQKWSRWVHQVKASDFNK